MTESKSYLESKLMCFMPLQRTIHENVCIFNFVSPNVNLTFATSLLHFYMNMPLHFF